MNLTQKEIKRNNPVLTDLVLALVIFTLAIVLMVI
jgi:hypothetical protein